MFDLLVIGGGLAGVVTALEARSTGARVALASRSWGATAMSTGALDIAFAPGSASESTLRRSIDAHAEAIASSRARHPYAVMGHENALSAIATGMGHLTRALGPAGLAPAPFDTTRANDAYVSSLGALVPAASALKTHAPIRGEGAIACIQLEGDTTFDAAAVAHAVQHDALHAWGRKVHIEPVFVRFDGQAANIALARNLDDLATADALAKQFAIHARGFATVIVPPVMGLRRYVQVLEMLSVAAEAPVVEALAHVPSVPGVRLQMALEKALRDAGVTLCRRSREPDHPRSSRARFARQGRRRATRAGVRFSDRALRLGRRRLQQALP